MCLGHVKADYASATDCHLSIDCYLSHVSFQFLLCAPKVG